MPDKCMVPACRRYYKNGRKVSSLSFPSDADLKQKWIHSIRRDLKVSLTFLKTFIGFPQTLKKYKNDLCLNISFSF